MNRGHRDCLKHLFTRRCFYHELSQLIREHLDETELGLALSQNVKSPPEASVFPRKEHGHWSEQEVFPTAFPPQVIQCLQQLQ